MTAPAANRPYVFELAALALNPEVGQDNARKTARDNGIDDAVFDRAVGVLRRVKDGGEDIDDFVLREYILDGWLQGYVPLGAQASNSMLTTWRLAQLAQDHYQRLQ